MILQSPHKMFWKTSITDPQDIGKYNIWSIHSYYPSLIHCYILDRLFSFVSSFLLIAFSSTAWAHLPYISQSATFSHQQLQRDHSLKFPRSLSHILPFRSFLYKISKSLDQLSLQKFSIFPNIFTDKRKRFIHCKYFHHF